MKNKFFFTTGMVGMLSGVASGAGDGANKGWFSEYRPYMTVRGGWQFGEGGTRDFFKHSAKHCECECEEEPQKCLGGFV